MRLLQEGIEKGLVVKTDRSTKMVIDGLTSTYPIYQVRVDALYFNDQNDRIATWLSQYVTEHHGATVDKSDLEQYNSIIQEFIVKSNPDKMRQTQMNIQMVGQQKHGVVLNDGRIIDGNRRFCCLRNLSKEDPSFNYFETVILEKDYQNNAKQVKMLELQIQIGEEARVDYDPIDRMVGLYRDVEENKLLTLEEYARSTNQKPAIVESELERAKLLVEFLEAVNMPKQYHIAREMNLTYPLEELQNVLKKIADEDKKQKMKYIAFTNILVSPSGDMTRFIRKLKDVATSQFLDELIEKEEEIAEQVLDELPKPGKMNKDTISEIRANEETKDALSRTMEVVTNKINVTNTKNKPGQMVDKAIDALSAVDCNIIKRLTVEQREGINESLDKLEELLEGIRESLNV